MKVLVCGGRDYLKYEVVSRVLTQLIVGDVEIPVVITGGCYGADALAKRWCTMNGVHCSVVEAMWEHYGRAAGPKRNAAMLRLKPDLVIAFPGGRGTADMVKQAKDAGIKVMEVSE